MGEGGQGRLGSLGMGGGGASRKGFLTPEEFEAELMRARPIPVFPLAGAQLQVSEEFIDDDPTEMSFYAGGAEAYSYGYDEKAEQFEYGSNAAQTTDYALSLGDLNGNTTSFSESAFGRSETSSLANNRSECSSLDNLPLGSAGDSLSLGFSGLDSSSSLRLPGSENLSEASSMVNFPAYSVRSEASSAMQFNELVEQLEQLSYPPTATEGSANGSSDSDSDWGSDGGLPPEQNLFFSNPLMGDTGVEGFLLECHNLRSLGLGEPTSSNQLNL